MTPHLHTQRRIIVSHDRFIARAMIALLICSGLTACTEQSPTSIPNLPATTSTATPAGSTPDSATEDTLARQGTDIRVTAELVNEGGDFTTAIPGTYDLPESDPLLTRVSVDSALDLVRRVRNAGGYDVGQLQVRLTFQSRRNQTIDVSSLDLTDLKESDAVRGTLLRLNEEGGVPNEQLVYDLSESLPRAHEFKPDGTLDEAPYFQTKSIQVSQEPTVVLIQFNANPYNSTTFRLRLKYRVAGEVHELAVDQEGQPFRVTSISCNKPGTYISDYDHAYNMVADPTYGLALRLSTDPHNLNTGIFCPSR